MAILEELGFITWMDVAPNLSSNSIKNGESAELVSIVILTVFIKRKIYGLKYSLSIAELMRSFKEISFSTDKIFNSFSLSVGI